MARIQISLPEQLPFSFEIQVGPEHINDAGHLDNALLLGLVSEARKSFIRSFGYSELNIEGVGIVIADAAVQYRSEAFAGETMRIRMGTGEVGSKGCDLLWCMTEMTSGREVARGKTGVVFFDYATRKAIAIPENLRSRLVEPALSAPVS